MKGVLSSIFRPKVKLGEVDTVVAALAVLLIGFGVVMVFSASAIEARALTRNPYSYLWRQSAFATVALLVIYTVSRFDYQLLRWWLPTYGVLAVVTGLLVASVAGFGHSGGGAARWLSLGPIHVQPSEMAKVALVLWLAYSLAKKQERVRSFRLGMVPHIAMVLVLMGLCLQQPDFGGAVVLGFLTFSLLFVAGVPVRYLVMVGAAGFGMAAWLVRFREYRWERMKAWLHMADHRQDLAYQPFQSVMSFGSGELTGVGLGQGLQVLYLPEAHTDFVAAIIGEELGLLGIVVLCGVYLTIVVRGVNIAMNADDEYGSYVAFGISVFFGAQALINLAVAMAMLPTKGLTLPFISYGGSSLLVNAAAMGLLLSVSRSRSQVRPAQGAVDSAMTEATPLVAGSSEFA
jgi:cell division protein FtsW